MRRWLVPHDLLPHSDAAANLAAREIALMGGGSVVIAHVGVPGRMRKPSTAGLQDGASRVVDGDDKDDRRHLEELVAQLTRTHQGVDIDLRSPAGSPPDELLQLVQDESIDRIVMAVESRSAISRFFLGSVSDDIVHKSPVPVLIVKSPLAGVLDELRVGAARDLKTT